MKTPETNWGFFAYIKIKDMRHLNLRHCPRKTFQRPIEDILRDSREGKILPLHEREIVKRYNKEQRLKKGFNKKKKK